LVVSSLAIYVCSISWIDRDRMSPFVKMPLNIFSADSWLHQLCYGMRHTANDTPPEHYNGAGYWQSTAIKPLAGSTIKVAANETILAHCLIKFRAGKAGDFIAIAVMGAPNHVPWVWCETILTYAAPKTLVLYGRGSGFPSHAFYCQGDRRGTLELTNDLTELRKIFTSGLKATTNLFCVPFYEDVACTIDVNDQAPTTEVVTAGQSIPDQPYSAPANPSSVRAPSPCEDSVRGALKSWNVMYVSGAAPSRLGASGAEARESLTTSRNLLRPS
jgi:hypothetical protein